MTVRAMAVIATLLLAGALLALWVLEAIVRGGTCGPAEGGGSCSPGVVSWLLLGGAVSALLASALLAFRPRRRRRR